MGSEDLSAATVSQRHDVADWMSGLDETALATPSLCAGWDIRTVGAHLAVAVTAGLPSFLVTALRHGSFHRANDAMARRMAQRPRSEIVGTLQANAHRRLSNPGTGPSGPLTDILVHAGDMRRPLGLPHDPRPELALAALTFLTGGRAFGFVARGTLAGLRLTADDVNFRWGAGEELRGRAADLMMAVCGRALAVGDLDGPGAEVLRGRLRTRV